MHFTRHSAYDDADVPVIVRGEGAYIWDARGKRYLDGLAGLFAVQVGHGREELAEAAARQTKQLAYFPLWGTRIRRRSSSPNGSRSRHPAT